MRDPATIICCIALALLLPAGAAAQAFAERRPDIVFVLVDDMRWDEYGAAGHPYIETPHIDRLARDGARFLNAFSTTPLCSPSRGSFLTGQYAHTHGITDNTARPSHALPTFARQLQQAGYRTGFFGKWHMGNDASPRPGFTRWVAMHGQGEAIDPLLNIDGNDMQTRGYVTDLLTDHALEFMEQAGAEQPFLVYLSHKAVHPNAIQHDDGSAGVIAGQPDGFVPAERHRGRYADRTPPRRASAFEEPLGKPALQRSIGDLPPLGRATATTVAEIHGRQEMLLAVDESLGRLLESLERSGRLASTVVMFASDHGYFYGEHGLNDERRLAYEETIRIPLLVRYPPRVAPGSTPERYALNIDVAPTLLEFAGLAPPATMQGRSLLPLLEGRDVPWRDAFLVEYYSDTVYPRILNMGYRALRTTQHKLIRYSELEGMDELYDLQADPYERHNLISAPEAVDLRERLYRELGELEAATGVSGAEGAGGNAAARRGSAP